MSLPWDEGIAGMSLPWDKFGEPPVPVVIPPAPAPAPPPIDVTGITDAIRDALGMGQPPPPPPPPPPPTPDPAREIVKADARSRSKRTLVQGLAFDVFAAVVASVALLSGADPFQKETWIGFGILLIKSVVSAGISYFMRLRSTPTIRTKGEKMAIMPVPRPMYDNERNNA